MRTNSPRWTLCAPYVRAVPGSIPRVPQIWACNYICKGVILIMQSMFRGAIAFAELLSCGFATIGVRATLLAIAVQLVDDTLFTLSGRRLSTAEV